MGKGVQEPVIGAMADGVGKVLEKNRLGLRQVHHAVEDPGYGQIGLFLLPGRLSLFPRLVFIRLIAQLENTY